MLNYILKHYHLQAKDWISYSSAPTKAQRTHNPLKSI